MLGNMSSWMACIPSLLHGCIDNLGTSFGASNTDTLRPGALLPGRVDKGGFYSRTSISQMQLLGEIGSSSVSHGRQYLGCVA